MTFRHPFAICLLFLVGSSLPTTVSGQTPDVLDYHPALVTAGTSTHNNQLGKFGESVARENLRLAGFEVHNANVYDKGIDILAVKRDASGALVKARIVEAKTRSNGTDFSLDSTADGKQLSRNWTDNRLNSVAKHHSSAETRKTAAEIQEVVKRNPKGVQHDVHGLDVGGDRYRTFRVDPDDVRVVTDTSDNHIARHLRRIEERTDRQVAKTWARAHLENYPKIQTFVPVPRGEVKTVAATPPVKTPTVVAPPVKSPNVGPASGWGEWMPQVRKWGKWRKWVGRGIAGASHIVESYSRAERLAELERKHAAGLITDADLQRGRMAAALEEILEPTGTFMVGAAGGFLGIPFGPAVAGTLVVVGGAVGGELGNRVAGAVIDQIPDSVLVKIAKVKDVIGTIPPLATLPTVLIPNLGWPDTSWVTGKISEGASALWSYVPSPW